MNATFKPEGYNSVSPYFIVSNATQFISLVKEIFGAESLRRFDRPDGTVMHAELKIDDSVIMLSDATEAYPAMPVVMHVYVPHVDEVFRKAIAAGCTAVEEPTEREGDPDRRATFKDFSGNLWSVGTQKG